jgi:hypothetical protein
MENYNSHHAHECLVRLGAWMPFTHAAEQLEAILGVQVSASTVRRLTEGAGKLCEQQQDALDQDQEQASSTSPMAMSADGAMVFVRGIGWQEVKTLVLAEVKPMPSKTARRACEKRTRAHSTFSRLSSAETFSELCSEKRPEHSIPVILQTFAFSPVKSPIVQRSKGSQKNGAFLGQGVIRILVLLNNSRFLQFHEPLA